METAQTPEGSFAGADVQGAPTPTAATTHPSEPPAAMTAVQARKLTRHRFSTSAVGAAVCIVVVALVAGFVLGFRSPFLLGTAGTLVIAMVWAVRTDWARAQWDQAEPTPSLLAELRDWRSLSLRVLVPALVWCWVVAADALGPLVGMLKELGTGLVLVVALLACAVALTNEVWRKLAGKSLAIVRWPLAGGVLIAGAIYLWSGRGGISCNANCAPGDVTDGLFLFGLLVLFLLLLPDLETIDIAGLVTLKGRVAAGEKKVEELAAQITYAPINTNSFSLHQGASGIQEWRSDLAQGDDTRLLPIEERGAHVANGADRLIRGTQTLDPQWFKDAAILTWGWDTKALKPELAVPPTEPWDETTVWDYGIFHRVAELAPGLVPLGVEDGLKANAGPLPHVAEDGVTIVGPESGISAYAFPTWYEKPDGSIMFMGAIAFLYVTQLPDLEDAITVTSRDGQPKQWSLPDSMFAAAGAYGYYQAMARTVGRG